MSPTESFVARTNIARMRLQVAAERDGATRADYERVLQVQVEILRLGEAEDACALPERPEEG